MRSRKILVPYDGSRSSDKALNEAMRLAKSLDTEIVLLNVVQEIALPPLMFESRMRSKITGEEITAAGMMKELCQQLKNTASKMLEERKSKLQGGVSITTKVLVGLPIDGIIDYADREKVEMIVIGSVGLGGISRLKALGSVSRGVAERAKCPVLIVH